jgi:plasmid stabilization system protein ParE
MNVSIEFAESALCDLEDILAWYSGLQVSDVGERFVREIFIRTEQLAVFPESGRIVPEFGVKTIRELIHPPFRLVYRLDPGKIWIVRIWRSERLLQLK